MQRMGWGRAARQAGEPFCKRRAKDEQQFTKQVKEKTIASLSSPSPWADPRTILRCGCCSQSYFKLHFPPTTNSMGHVANIIETKLFLALFYSSIESGMQTST